MGRFFVDRDGLLVFGNTSDARVLPDGAGWWQNDGAQGGTHFLDGVIKFHVVLRDV